MMISWLRETRCVGLGTILVAALVLGAVMFDSGLRSSSLGFLILLLADLSILALFNRYRSQRIIGGIGLTWAILCQFITKKGSVAGMYLVGSGDIFYGNLVIIPTLLFIAFLFSRLPGSIKR